METIKKFALIVVIAVLTAACGNTDEVKLTPLQFAEQEAERVQSERKAQALNNRTIAQEVACGDIIDIAHNPYDGKARFWTGEDPDGKLHCYNSFGYNRWTGDKLEAINADVITKIRNNPKCYPKTIVSCGPRCDQSVPASVIAPVQPPPAPSVPPAAPALRVLDEGPCCRL